MLDTLLGKLSFGFLFNLAGALIHLNFIVNGTADFTNIGLACGHGMFAFFSLMLD